MDSKAFTILLSLLFVKGLLAQSNFDIVELPGIDQEIATSALNRYHIKIEDVIPISRQIIGISLLNDLPITKSKFDIKLHLKSDTIVNIGCYQADQYYNLNVTGSTVEGRKVMIDYLIIDSLVNLQYEKYIDNSLSESITMHHDILELLNYDNEEIKYSQYSRQGKLLISGFLRYENLVLS